MQIALRDFFLGGGEGWRLFKIVSKKYPKTVRHLVNSVNVVDVYSASKVANLNGQVKSVFPKLLFFF